MKKIEKSFLIQIFSFDTSSEYLFLSKEYYQILLISSGNCQFKMNGNEIDCNTENAVFLKPGNQISMCCKPMKFPMELLSICIHPSYLEELSDETCDLNRGFSFVPRSKSIIRLEAKDAALLKNEVKSMLRVCEEQNSFGQAFYVRNMQAVFIIQFLRACISSDHVLLSRHKKQLVLDDIFIYIREHLTEDLSLEVLEKHFFVSRHHLCREFKKNTGQTIHSYIVKSRLNLCKKYIEEGKTIKEVYKLGGFSGYNHFFCAFKKEYGMTPKEYYESLTE